MYSAGLTSAEETAQVQGYVKKYPEVAEELLAIEQSVESYIAASAINPHPSVKAAIFEKINANGSVEIKHAENAKVIPFSQATEPADKAVPISAFWKKMAAAAVLLLFGSVLLNMLLYNKNNATSGELQQTKELLAGIEDKAKAMEQDMQVVQSRYSMPVALNPMENMPDAAAKVFWMKNSGEVYIDPSNLPDVPEGKQYQLWAIVDGKPVDGGMILTTKKGDKYRIQKMKTFGRAEAFAVTLESESGNTSPKGPMYVMGKM
jgi:hypothetical protein